MKFPISRRFSRRGKLPAAAAYENHAAWRRSAAADNTDHMPPKMLVSGILILTYFGTVDLGNPILCNGSDVSNLYATHPVPK